MDGISLHNYTIPSGNWDKKGSATRFDVAAWHATLRGALRMDELIRKHLAVIACEVRGSKLKKVGGRILTGSAITAHNTSAAPNAVVPRPFLGARLVDGKLRVQLPARSVVMLELG
jgi:alpha-L-arabinofuranosidase